jgi:hypothetical protein
LNVQKRPGSEALFCFYRYDTFDSSDVLPGFTLPVKAIFKV